MISKQLLLGIGLVLGGGALVGVLNSGSDKQPAQQEYQGEVAYPKVEPLKQDIQTEKHLSEQKKKERENNTLAQEQEVKEFVEEQERAKQLGLTTGTANTNSTTPATSTTSTTNTINASVNSVVSEVSAMLPDMQQTTPTAQTSQPSDTTETVVVQPRPEAIVATKKAEENRRRQQARAKQQKINATKKDQHIIARGDSLSKLSAQYGVPVSTILSANNMRSSDMLIAGDILIIPGKNGKKAKASQAVTAKKSTDKKPANNTSQTAKKAKKSDSARHVKPFYSVQVSLADNEAKANELAKKYRQAGYKVQTSKTNRGVRVLVGSASNAEDAKKLKAKLDKDNRVNSGDAWVKRVDTLNP